ncbi:MAG: hypothetical protein D6B27_09585 [Gammaproteobacteria bacterium]|nr:MAG: hypothetical protein D6B27_09585 [Gammaproteobacteria bacterium]
MRIYNKSFFLLIILLFSSFCLAEKDLSIRFPLTKKINATMTLSDFVVDKHIISKYGNYIYAIDGKLFWGTDGGIPKKYIKDFSIEIDDKTISLEVSSMFGIENITSKDSMQGRIKIKALNDYIYRVSANFSDGAGAYIVQWLIINDRSARVFIGNGEELSDVWDYAKDN